MTKSKESQGANSKHKKLKLKEKNPLRIFGESKNQTRVLNVCITL